MEEALVDRECRLEKFEGKGGWTYTQLPEVPMAAHAPFGWVRVKGSIDGYPIARYHLMPMGNGMLFLPVKAAIRKRIRKAAGDVVHVLLYLDRSELEIPPGFEDSLLTEPAAHAFFHVLGESEQENFIKYIYSSERQATRERRMVRCLELLAKGRSLRMGSAGEHRKAPHH